MPRRSNMFQRVVHSLVKQLAPQGAVARSSVELLERESGARREVDTLIEIGAGVTMVRIAIECREHGRRADVGWIDELIGKYSRLPIDRVVAVSASGFSRAAQAKAQSHNIDLLSPKEVSSIDWPARFPKPNKRILGVGWISYHPKVLFVVDGRGHWARLRSTDSVRSGEDVCDGQTFAAEVLQKVQARIKAEVDGACKDAVSAATDTGSSDVVCEIQQDDTVLLRRGKEHQVKKMILVVELRVSEFHHTRYAEYADALVGRVTFAGYDIASVQAVGRTEAALVFEVPPHLRTRSEAS